MKSNQEWIKWGSRDPLFGVATWPGHEREGPKAWTNEAFYEMGKSDWSDFIARWVRYGVITSSCVEIGSGAGRLTGEMARTFDHVYATDVSVDMLSYAKGNIDTKNVVFVVTNGRDLPMESESVTAAFSTHVFQHFDSPRDGARYFVELARVLTRNGSLMVHLPIHSFPIAAGKLLSGMRLLYSARKKVGNVRAALRRLASSLIDAKPTIRGLSYEMVWVLELLRGLGFTDVEFAFFPVRSNNVIHSFVFARKENLQHLGPLNDQQRARPDALHRVVDLQHG
jgi:ubiquinone/menaquinone biosynthesis C-methylase UbiE